MWKSNAALRKHLYYNEIFSFWTILEDMVKQINEFRMWIYKKTLKITWNDQINNKMLIATIISDERTETHVLRTCYVKRNEILFSGKQHAGLSGREEKSGKNEKFLIGESLQMVWRCLL